MGAETFCQLAAGDTPKLAFESAVSRAQWDHGHAGYTGTIAEKDSFIMIEAPPETVDEIRRSNWLPYNPEDGLWEKVDDKWGPAGCIDLGGNHYFFFGWASS